jgi:formamidopyrimidine-DNA glycosylase
MPELPEVEIVRRGLKAKIPGETIRKVEIFRQESIGYPKTKRFANLLVGRTFTDVSRRGKYLLLHLDSKNKAEQPYLIVHLRMSGRLLLLEQGIAAQKKFRFLRVQIVLESGRVIYF